MYSKNIIIAISSLALFGCANNPFSSYKSTTSSRLNQIYNGNVESAIQVESTTDVLFNMEYGSLLRMSQKYEQSNLYFDKAQDYLNDWTISWANTTQGQWSRTAASLLINDNVNDYNPRGYEKTFLNTLHALNQADLNNLNNARVEITRMYQVEQAIENYNQYMYLQEQAEVAKTTRNPTENYVYQQILRNYNFKDINSPQVLALKNSYQNAFSHYLAGFIFEALNEPSLARPGYVKSGQLNPTNTLIQNSIDNIDKNVRPKSGYTDLLIVEEIGHAPQIQSNQINIPVNFNTNNNGSNGNNGCINMINIFYPTLIMDNKNQPSYNYLVDTQNMSPMLMTDVDLMAARSLHDEIPHIISRNITAAIRNITTSQLSCSGDSSGLLSLGLSLGSIFIDKADERNWNLLPSKVSINRTTLPYGKHTISITVNGQTYSQQFNLTQPYQIVTFRVIGNQVLFNLQKSMFN